MELPINREIVYNMIDFWSVNIRERKHKVKKNFQKYPNESF